MVNYTELNDGNYSDFIKDGVVLVDVYTTWCGPCKVISPIIDQISSDYYGQIKVGKLDADQNPETVTELLVRNIPTILIYKDGEIVERKVGAIQKRDLTDLIDQYL